ncbi:MAG: substrate-binding domain-containing protein [Chloroflexota bacterium]
MNHKISRRQFLQVSAGATTLLGLAACAPASAPGGGEGAGAAVTTIQAYLGSTFQPGVVRGEGLTPLQVAQDLADEWVEMHEGFAVEYIDGPGGEELTQWIKSRQAAGTMPDINVAADNELNRDIAAGYWQTVDDFIDDPNPYIPDGQPGSGRWQDAFIAGFDARNRMIDGRYYGVPQSINAVQVYCNLNLLEQAGVDFENEIIDPRWTFDGMLAISQRLQDADITPWALAWSRPYWNWIQTTALSGFLKSTGKWSVLDTNDDDFVTSIERFEAIDRGDWTADSDEFRAMHKLAEDWVPYWSEGYLGLSSEEMVALFARGQAAFMWNSTGAFPVLNGDPERDFEFAVARFPLLFERMAEIGDGGPTQYPGGAWNTLAITSTAIENGTVEDCIDFLKYFTSCDGQGRLSREHGGVVPAVHCAEGIPELEQFKPAPDETFLLTIHMTSMNFDYGESYQRITSEWLGGVSTYDEAMAQFQPVMEQFATDAIERSGG